MAAGQPCRHDSSPARGAPDPAFREERAPQGRFRNVRRHECSPALRPRAGRLAAAGGQGRARRPGDPDEADDRRGAAGRQVQGLEEDVLHVLEHGAVSRRRQRLPRGNDIPDGGDQASERTGGWLWQDNCQSFWREAEDCRAKCQ